MHRISSDTKAKVSVFAVAIILLVVGSAAALCGYFLVNNMNNKTYEVTLTITDMEVASDSGIVYNVCNDTVGGKRYFNPMTEKFDLASPSNEAVLYVSATVSGTEKYSNTNKVTVQTSKTPVPGAAMEGNSVKFKVSSSADSINMTLFLLIRGAPLATEPQTLANGSPVDIFENTPGQSGIHISVDLKNGIEDINLKGNENSDVRGLLLGTVTVKVI